MYLSTSVFIVIHMNLWKNIVVNVNRASESDCEILYVHVQIQCMIPMKVIRKTPQTGIKIM